jgi:hypothetical protein
MKHPKKWSTEERESALQYSENQDFLRRENEKTLARLAFLEGILWQKKRVQLIQIKTQDNNESK